MRAWCGVRACSACGGERARAAGEYPTSLVGIKMRYGPADTRDDRAPAPAPRAARCAARAARHKRPRRASFQPSLHLSFDLPLQAVAHEHVGHNSLQHISYGMGFPRVNQRIYRVKPAIGGEGVRPGYTTATATHSPPQIFLRQLAPFALALHL